MNAAWKIFSENGYERTSMDSVVALCGGSKATLYSHFNSKEELLREIILDRTSELASSVYEPFDEDGEVTEQLQKFGERYLNLLLNTDIIELYRLATAQGSCSEFGRAVYERGFKMEWCAVSTYLKKKIPPEKFLHGGEWTAATQLKGLLDGEMVMRRLWGVVKKVDQEEITRIAKTAITAFLRIYAPDQVSADNN
jgi:Transcriptional regulator